MIFLELSGNSRFNSRSLKSPHQVHSLTSSTRAG